MGLTKSGAKNNKLKGSNNMNTCRLCGGSYDFRKIQIGECLGGIGISFNGSLQASTEENRFKFCPECGRKLTAEKLQNSHKKSESEGK